MWLLLLLHAIFASTYTLGKAGLLYMEPIFLIAVRLLICAVLLFMLHAGFRRSFFIERKDRWLFGGMSFFLFYSYVPSFAVLSHIESTKWALIYTLTPFCTALISYVHKLERMTWLKIIGLCIGFIGILPVLIVDPKGTSFGTFWNVSWPEIVVILCMVSYSYGWVMATRLVKERGYNTFLVNGAGMLFAGVGALATSPLIDTWSPSPVYAIWPAVGVMSLLVVATLLAYTINTYLLRYYTVTFLMFLMFVDPIYVALYGRIFLKEPFQWHFFLSVGLVFFGLSLFYKEELKHGYILSS